MLRSGLPQLEPEQGLAVPALLPASALKLQGSHRVKVPEALPLGSQKLTGRGPSVPFAWWAPWDHPKSKGGAGAGVDAWDFWSGRDHLGCSAQGLLSHLSPALPSTPVCRLLDGSHRPGAVFRGPARGCCCFGHQEGR